MEFFGIEVRICAIEVLEFKMVLVLEDVEFFWIFWIFLGIWEGPSEECSGIDNGFGEVAHILEITDTLAMISFTQVISQRIMSINGDWELECFGEQDMFRGIIQMILASDDVGYLH